MGRLSIDVTDQQHQSLKAMAALQGKTLRQYALDLLLPEINDASALQELKSLLVARAAEGAKGKVSTKSVDDILAEELAGE